MWQTLGNNQWRKHLTTPAKPKPRWELFICAPVFIMHPFWSCGISIEMWVRDHFKPFPVAFRNRCHIIINASLNTWNRQGHLRCSGALSTWRNLQPTVGHLPYPQILEKMLSEAEIDGNWWNKMLQRLNEGISIHQPSKHQIIKSLNH